MVVENQYGNFSLPSSKTHRRHKSSDYENRNKMI